MSGGGRKQAADMNNIKEKQSHESSVSFRLYKCWRWKKTKRRESQISLWEKNNKSLNMNSLWNCYKHLRTKHIM